MFYPLYHKCPYARVAHSSFHPWDDEWKSNLWLQLLHIHFKIGKLMYEKAQLTGMENLGHVLAVGADTTKNFKPYLKKGWQHIIFSLVLSLNTMTHVYSDEARSMLLVLNSSSFFHLMITWHVSLRGQFVRVHYSGCYNRNLPRWDMSSEIYHQLHLKISE